MFGKKWPDQIRCLGIYVGHEINKNFNSNWNNKIDKTKVILKRWKERDLSLFGKVHVIKTFAIMQFVLPASLLSVPPEVMNKLTLCCMIFYGGQEIRLRGPK